MKRSNRSIFPVTHATQILAGSILSLLMAGAAQAQFSLAGSSYMQDFNGSPTTATANSLPTGWVFSDMNATFVSGSNQSTRGAGNTGTGTLTQTSAGGAYYFVNGVLATDSDRSIGYLTSGSFSDNRNIIFGFTNDTGSTIVSLALAFDYEKYRSGTATRDWTFSTSVDGATWGSSITDGAQSYAADANTSVILNPATSIAKTVTLTGLSIEVGTSYYFRWNYDGSGTGTGGQALGLDNFSFAATFGSTPIPNYWDLNGTGTGLGGAGPAVWNTTSSNWTSNNTGTGAVKTFDPAMPTFFSGTAGVVTVDAAGVAPVGSITFESDGYQVNGPGTITLAGTGQSVVVSTVDHTATIAAAISGSNGLTKSGAGRLVLSSASGNSYTGSTTVSAGVLSINKDNQLGATTNGLVFGGGTLETTADIVLDAGRAISGAAALNVAPSTTLTVLGAVATTSLTLANSGTVSLDSATSNVGAITFNDAGTLASTGVIGATTIAYTPNGASTAYIAANLDLGNALRTVTVADGAENTDLTITGTIKLTGGGSNRLHKLGTGTLRLEGDNSGPNGLTGSLRIGTAGNTPAPGGTVVITNNKAMGNGDGIQVQFNAGILRATADMIGSNAIPLGLSLGAGQGVPATFNGSPMEFAGNSNIFKPAGATYQHKITINTDVIFSGTLGVSISGGAGSGSSGVTLDGTGSLTLAAAMNAHDLPISLTQATLYVNGELSASTATVYVDGLGRLRGSGTITGNTTVALDGILAPGTATGPESLTFGGTLDVSGAVGSAGPGLEFRLGTVSDRVELTNSALTIGAGLLEFGDFAFTAGSGFGPGVYTLFDTPTQLDGSLGFQLDGMIAGFDASLSVSGDGQDVLLTVIPEPGSALFLLGGLVLVGARCRRRSTSDMK